MPKKIIRITDFYQATPIQQRWHNSPALYPLMEGGRGGGKSLGLLMEPVYQCVIVPNSNSILLRRTITAAEKGGIEDLFLKRVPRDMYRNLNLTKHCVTWCNDAKLFFGHIRSDSDLAQYQSAEFLFIGFDELTQFTYQQWNYMKGSNRCPVKFDIFGKPTRPRMGGATNPNGIGSGWVKALWITKRPPAGEMILNYRPEDYEAIHSTFEDNPTYANDADYIGKLMSISDPVLRQAWIPGDWNILAGQFFQNWEEARHVRALDDVEFEEFQENWIAIDWGYHHACVVVWFTRGYVVDGFGRRKSVVVIRRELVVHSTNEELLAEKIGKMTPKDEKVRSIFLSPDAFNKINEEHSIADRMGDVLREFSLPRPERANNERINGWRAVHSLLDTDGLVVLNTCPDVIDSVPKLQRDPKKLEDALKTNELYDDVMDAVRYGVISWESETAVPRDVMLDRRIKAIKSPQMKYLEYLKIQAESGKGLALDIPTRHAPGSRK